MAIRLRSYFLLLSITATGVHQSTGQNVYCNFENSGACGYSKAKNSFGWKRTKTADLLMAGIDEPPSGDHTTGNGHFMHVTWRSKNANKNEFTARLKSPWEGHKQDFFTLEFYYFTRAKQSSDCELRIHINNIRTENNTIASWRRPCTKTDGQWSRASLILHSETMFQIMFEVIFRGNAEVAIDDVGIIYDDVLRKPYTDVAHPTVILQPRETTVSIISLLLGILNTVFVVCAVAFLIYTKRHGGLPRILEYSADGTYTSLRRDHAPSKPVTCVTYEVPADKMKESNYSFDIPAMHIMKRADSGLTEDQDGSECVIGSSNYLNLTRSNDYIYQVVQNDSTLVSMPDL
ncbi:uncharacterized protein [Antedon mediterranea]|uniref:uncharacterized protein n=1 Tax=Antedon mediterranea TaxID=105859 RepID=UPI003AF5EFBF